MSFTLILAAGGVGLLWLALKLNRWRLTRKKIQTTRLLSKNQDQLERKILEKDLDDASTIQERLMPPVLIETSRCRVASFFRPSSQCGGDFWDTFELKGFRTFIISDATGHGFAPALVTAAVKGGISTIRSIYAENNELLTPAVIAKAMNTVVYDACQGKIELTAFVLRLDLETGDLLYVNAGHRPVWVLKRNSKQIESLVSPSKSLGVPDQTDIASLANVYQEQVSKLEIGDRLFFYTDGLLDATNASGESFSKLTAREMLIKNWGVSPVTSLNSLVASFLLFNAQKPLDDDVTLVLAEWVRTYLADINHKKIV